MSAIRDAEEQGQRRLARLHQLWYLYPPTPPAQLGYDCVHQCLFCVHQLCWWDEKATGTGQWGCLECDTGFGSVQDEAEAAHDRHLRSLTF